MGRFIKVMLRVGMASKGYYPPEVKRAMEGLKFPYNRIGTVVLALERDGAMGIVPSAGTDMTDIVERDGATLTIAGRTDYYYAYDSIRDVVCVYHVVRVDTSQPWYIREDYNGDAVCYIKRTNKYRVLYEDIHYCIPEE